MSNLTKNTFFYFIRKAAWAGIALCITFIALVGLGALAEDSNTTASIISHFAGKSIILIFAFFAAKIPLLFLIKGIAISSGTSALIWREAINVQLPVIHNQNIEKIQAITRPYNTPNNFGTTSYIKQKLNLFEVY